MRALALMDTIQIDITDACIHACSNCTRFCGHREPYFMDEATFRAAVESLVDFPQMVGVMGGEPMLHPQFGAFLDYIGSRIPPERVGLWTCFPEGEKYRAHRERIVRVVGNLFLNDHSRDDIYHAPLLVAAEEVIPDERSMWLAVEQCWIQQSWSATVNPKGAWFCEVAGALSVLFDGPDGWPVEPGWWKRVPKDFREQQEWACRKCGAALPLRRRKSVEEVDDVSPKNLERLTAVKSRRVRQGRVRVSDLRPVPDPEPMAAYKDTAWRNRIAARYGLFLTINEKGFWQPHLREDAHAVTQGNTAPSLFGEYVCHCPGALLQIASPR